MHIDDNDNFYLATEPLLRNQAMDIDPDYSAAVQVSSDSAGASMRQKKKSVKTMEVDEPQELRNAQLAQWNAEYTQNMAAASKQKEQKKLITIAKKNAEFWVFGKGIGSVGVGLVSYETPHPLNAFSGGKLLEMLTGTKKTGSERKRGRKSKDDPGSSIENGRRVRPRNDEAGRSDHGEDLEMHDIGEMVYDVYLLLILLSQSLHCIDIIIVG
jgi:meiotic recombination protein REC8